MRTSRGKLCCAGLVSGAAVLLLALGGCGVLATDSEKEANAKLSATEPKYRPGGEKPVLPELKEGSPFEDYLSYALLNSQEVEEAYYEWASAVYTITVARSLPDPKLTFQMDVQGGFIPSIMPGLTFDVPGPGKLTTAANIAAASSDVKYNAFAAKALEAAFKLEKSCWELRYLDAKLKAFRSSLALLGEAEAQARALNATGRAGIQDVLRAQIEEEKLKTAIGNLEESREPLLENFKAALGLKPEQAIPPLPSNIPDFPSELALSGKLLSDALANNPQLKAVEAEIRQAEASLSMAQKANIPDFSGGAELDALAIPILVRPMASMTLPIWRDKIAAGIASAQAAKKASEAKLGAAQIALAVQCAEKRYLAREAARNLETLRNSLVPKAAQALDAARSAYAANGVDFLTLLEAERTLLNFDVETAAAVLQKNSSLAELSIVLAGNPPSEAPYQDLNIGQGKPIHNSK